MPAIPPPFHVVFLPVPCAAAPLQTPCFPGNQSSCVNQAVIQPWVRMCRWSQVPVQRSIASVGSIQTPSFAVLEGLQRFRHPHWDSRHQEGWLQLLAATADTKVDVRSLHAGATAGIRKTLVRCIRCTSHTEHAKDGNMHT